MSPARADELGYKPLDGGWGWIVVVGAHISIGFAYSTPKTLSIFFKEIQEDLGASYSEIAWVSSIMLAVMYAGGELIQSVLLWEKNHYYQLHFTVNKCCICGIFHRSVALYYYYLSCAHMSDAVHIPASGFTLFQLRVVIHAAAFVFITFTSP